MSDEPIDPNSLTGGAPRRSNGQPQGTPPGLLRGVAMTRLVGAQTFSTRGGGASDEVRIPVGGVFKVVFTQLEDLIAHVLVEDASANLSLRLEGEYSANGETWTAFTVLPTQTGSGYYISATFTDRTKFGILVRFRLVLTDAGAVESGTFTADLALHFLS